MQKIKSPPVDEVVVIRLTPRAVRLLIIALGVHLDTPMLPAADEKTMRELRVYLDARLAGME